MLLCTETGTKASARDVNYCNSTLQGHTTGKRVELATDRMSHVVLTGHW